MTDEEKFVPFKTNMKKRYFSILTLFLTCFIISSEAQEVISADARKFCNQLRTAAGSNTLRRVDSIAKNYRPHNISEKEIMDIANSMSRGGDGAMAIAMMICMAIAELAAEKAIEQHQQAISLVNNLYNKSSSRRARILRSVNSAHPGSCP